MNQNVINNVILEEVDNTELNQPRLEGTNNRSVLLPSTTKPNENSNQRIDDKKNKYTSVDEIPLTLTVAELADILNIGRNTAYELIKTKEIKYFYVGRQIRIYKSQLLAYMGERAS